MFPAFGRGFSTAGLRFRRQLAGGLPAGRTNACTVNGSARERLDGRNLATKAVNPTLSIARRGDEYLFALNGQVGLQKTIKNLSRGFHVMLYGYGSSENNWDSVQVLMPKKP